MGRFGLEFQNEEEPKIFAPILCDNAHHIQICFEVALLKFESAWIPALLRAKS